MYTCLCAAFHCHQFLEEGEECRPLLGAGSKSAEVTTWDRTIVCLPQTYPNVGEDTITIPRKKRPILSWHGLIGKIHLESDWSEDAIFVEVRSVFRDAMGAQCSCFLVHNVQALAVGSFSVKAYLPLCPWPMVDQVLPVWLRTFCLH